MPGSDAGAGSGASPWRRCSPEKHTVRLIILPGITALTTIMMTFLEYEETPLFHEYLEDTVREKLAEQGVNATIDTKDMFWRLDPTQDFLVSNCINNPTPEQWSGFVARWVMWHTALFFIVECKLDILPRQLAWLPIFWGLTLLVVIYSGFHQTEMTPYSMHYGETRLMLHILFAFIAFFTCWIEAVCLWCQSRLFHTAYGVLVFMFPISMQFISKSLGTVVEWAVLVLHLVVVWYKYPEVKKGIEDGTWKPWVGCCHCCCPSIEAAEGGNSCCPPPEGCCSFLSKDTAAE